MKGPYPWFGGKAKTAPLIWRRLGAGVRSYVEPFFGGGAVLLARPRWDAAAYTETVNDINAWLCNFWRAVKADPDAVARHASDPVSELDLHARGDWLFYREGVDREFIERLRSDPDWHDAKSAGWWVWGQSSWIGDNWGRRECRARPQLMRGKGVNRQLPHLRGGKGVNRQLPNSASDGCATTREAAIRDYMRQLCERMARVRVCCGDWTRVLGRTPTVVLGTTGVFLDPPYAVEDRDAVYGEHESRTLAHDVREWAIEHGGDRRLRIALCGYDGEHAMPESWECWAWKARGGYGNQRKAKDNANGARERVWFSPHCLAREESMFEGPREEDDDGSE